MRGDLWNEKERSAAGYLTGESPGNPAMNLTGSCPD